MALKGVGIDRFRILKELEANYAHTMFTKEVKPEVGQVQYFRQV